MYQATPFQLVVSLKLQFVLEHFQQLASVQVVIVISVVQDQSFPFYKKYYTQCTVKLRPNFEKIAQLKCTTNEKRNLSEHDEKNFKLKNFL